jgi:putative transposase
LWEGRYKATLIDSENYALTCYRYIELNPVRADMVSHPGEYPWSSYRANALGETNPIITPHYLYEGLNSDREARQLNYRALFDAHISSASIKEIREMTNKSWVLGSDYFKQRIQGQLNRPAMPEAKGGDRKSKRYKESQMINRV